MPYRARSTDVWFNAPGIDAVYQPVSAPNLFAARQNVSNDMRLTRYNATPGSSPSWSAKTGWYFAGAQYFKTGIIPLDGNVTLIVRFSGLASSTAPVIIGTQQSASASEISLQPSSTYRGGASWLNGGGLYTASGTYLSSAVVGLSGQSAFVNGQYYGQLTAGTWLSNPVEFYLGARNNNGTPLWYATAYIQSVLVALRTMSNAEMAQTCRQMTYCDANPDWSAWGRRRRWYYAPSALPDMAGSESAIGAVFGTVRSQAATGGTRGTVRSQAATGGHRGRHV